MNYYSGADLARSFRLVRKNTLQLAHDIPLAQFDYRATPDTRSISETLVHIAGNPLWQQKLHAARATSLSFEDYGNYMKDVQAFTSTLTDRDAILEALEKGGETFGTFLESLSDSTLGERVQFAPGSDPLTKTRFEMLLGVKEHEMHHRGQLMVLQRLIGIVPHLTRARMAR